MAALPKPNNLSSTLNRQAKIPTTVRLLKKCQNFQEVRQVHAQLVKLGLLDHPLNSGRLLESYVRLSHIHYAWSVFDRMSCPDVFACNTIMRGLTACDNPYNSLLIYNKLLVDGLSPDNYTYTFVLKACSRLKALFEGRQVHCHLIKAGIAPDTYVHSSLIRMYTNSGSIACAERVLKGFEEENVLAENSMISGYFGFGYVEEARKMFDNMVTKDVATWSAMVTGYSDNGLYGEALSIFKEMMAAGISPNESALVSSLCACAHLGALDQGRWIHAYVDEIGFGISVSLGTALIDMYAKCGCIDRSYEIFQKLSSRKDVITWGAIISGFAIHGRAEKCFQLFDEMVSEGIEPNAVIFVAILSACSHAGYVEAGRCYFYRMMHDFGVTPSIEHYGCMVDLLGRAGRLAEAEKFILSMPEKPNSIIWGMLLGACRMHNDVKRGNMAFQHLVELEPMSGDRYKLAGLMYSNAGKQENTKRIRRFIAENDLETTRGLSFIEINGVVNEFVAGSVDHEKNREIYSIWKGLTDY
ncbi:hypothetical protein UlMin_003988 [Ulmus minor]